MKFELKPDNRNSSDESLLDDLKEVAKKLGKKTLSRVEYDKHGRYSEGTLRKRFGGWLNALEKAGLPPTRQYLQDQELLDELKKIAKLLDTKYVSKDIFKKHSQISNTTTIERRFGSWSKALKKAGLNISPSGRRYSNEDFFENLLNVWTYYGRQPSIVEINKSPSVITGASYSNRFGNWRKALEAFVQYANEEETEPMTKNENPVSVVQNVETKIFKHKTSRNINWRLRFKVFQHFDFKCKFCGSSTATDHSVKLEVDHIKAWANGGETELENLQLLCSKCNSGKSNLE